MGELDYALLRMSEPRDRDAPGVLAGARVALGTLADAGPPRSSGTTLPVASGRTWVYSGCPWPRRPARRRYTDELVKSLEEVVREVDVCWVVRCL